MSREVSVLFEHVQIESICDNTITFYTENGAKYTLPGQQCEEDFDKNGMPYGCFVAAFMQTEFRSPVAIYYHGDVGRAEEEVHFVGPGFYVFEHNENQAVLYDGHYRTIIMTRDKNHIWYPDDGIIHGRVNGLLHYFHQNLDDEQFAEEDTKELLARLL